MTTDLEAEQERKPPHNVDAEQAVLAAMILNHDVLNDILASIKEEDFYRVSHRLIFSAISEMSRQNIPVDQLTLADKLQALGTLDQVGGKPYILALADNSYALANWASHVQIVKNDAVLRDLISAAQQIIGLGYSDTDEADIAVEEAEKLLFAVTNKRVSSNFLGIKELMSVLEKNLEAMGKEKSDFHGVTTGFVDLNRVLAGMRGGDLIILAARPGVGKTSLALNIAVSAAQAGNTIAFFSLEMPSQQLVSRILSATARVDSSKMRTGNLDTTDWQKLIEAIDKLKETAFFIDDSPELSIMELRAKARRQLRNVEPGKGLVVVDYLQLMSPAKRNAMRDRHLEVAEISRGLKILAKELGVPVLALSQLNRSVEGRSDKRPQLSDLRESGSIEQDADVVIFIDRSLSEEEALLPKRPDENTAVLIVGKNRNGPQRDIKVMFDSNYTNFNDLDVRHADYQ